MEEEDRLTFRGVQGEILFVLLTILYFVIARFVAVVTHEILGHGLVSELVGGEFYAVYISPGPGYTAAYIPNTTPLALQVFYLMSGIVAELVIGLIVLFLVYPRLKSFFHRLFALLLLEVMLIHALTYMWLASVYGEGGDTMQVIGMLPGVDQFWAIRFIMVGLLFTVAFAYVITSKALELLREHFELRTRRSALRILLLFWLPHLAVGYLAGLFGSGLVTEMVLNYLILFVSVTVLVFLVASFFVSRKPLFRPGVVSVGRRGVFATFIAFLLVLSVWFLAFGVAPSTAHGVLLREPPAQEEVKYTEGYAVNLRLKVDQNFNITAEVRMKAFADVSGPLEEAIWETFDKRPYWNTYQSRGLSVVRESLNYSGWVEVNHSIGARVHGFGEVWSNGKLMTFRFDVPGLSLFQDREGKKILRVYDPWKDDFTGGNEYLDALNVTWHESITLDNYSGGGGLGPVNEGNTSSYVSWIYSSYEEANVAYVLTFLP